VISKKTVSDLANLMIDHIPDGLYMVNPEHEIIAWNEAMVRLTEISRSEAIGSKDYLLSSPLLDARPSLSDLVLGTSLVLGIKYSNLLIENDIYHANLRLKPKPLAPTQWYSLRALPIHNSDGSFAGVMNIVVDTSQDKKVSETKQENELQFHNMAENLEDMLYRVEFHPMYHFKYLSPVLSRAIDVEADSLYEDFYKVLDHVHPRMART